MLLMHRNATVTICHTRTVDVPALARQAEILITAAGVLHSVTPEYTNPEQIVVDVGINWDEARGGISGDVDFEAVEPRVRAITPVPGGVGGVTTCVLADHVLQAARRLL
jgi:methylenetetrahydrofolate dehydrogenase (NADP+)/methenyltetrahydrofolate cyclohydrolase